MAGDSVGPPPWQVAPSDSAADAVQPSPGSDTKRISRTGSIIFAAGLVLISVSVFLLTYVDYVLLSGHQVQPNEIAGVGGSSDFLAGLGVLVVVAGWALDQRATYRVAGKTREDPHRLRARIGMAVLLAGACGIAVSFFYSALFEFAELANYNVSGLVSTWSTIGLELTLGLGFLAVALGWFVFHRVALERLEATATG